MFGIRMNSRSGGHIHTSTTAVITLNRTPDNNRYMFFATRNREPSGSLVVANTNTNFVATRIKVGSPQYSINSLRLHYSGFALTEGGLSPQETVLPVNSTSIDAVYIEVGGVFTQATFAAANTVSIASANTGSWTDDIVLSSAIPAENDIYMWTFYHTAAAANQIPVYRIQTHNGERVWGATDLATLTAKMANPTQDSTASLLVNYGSVAQPAYYGPDTMVAKGWDGRPVALVVTDSIGEARQEYSLTADSRGNMGWLRRWLDKKANGYGRTPHFVIGVPGSASVRELNTSATKRWDIIDQVKAWNTGSALPFTVMFNQLGQNDTNSNYITWWTNYSGFVTRFKTRYAGIRIVASTTFGRTTSSDKYTSAAGQTFAAQNVYPAVTSDNTTGKWLFRNDMLANRSSAHDALIDTFDVWSDPVGLGKWRTSLNYPIGTVIGQAGDGVVGWNVFTGSDYIPPGSVAVMHYNGGGYTARTINSVTGTGPYTYTCAETDAAIVADGTQIYAQPTTDGIHPQIQVIQYLFNAIPQSHKSKLEQ